MLLAALLLGLLSPTPGRTQDETESSPPPPRKIREWEGVRSWVYQLQHLDVGKLRRAPADLLVIDYSRDGSRDGALTRAEVRSLQESGKLVVAYLSIGEAEPYRFYWQDGWRPGSPSWIRPANPNWPDNYPVEFWDPQWQSLLFGSPGSYLDQILEAGFDGVYLDIVDGYEAFVDTHDAPDRKMIELVQAIAAYARERAGPDFGVFPQNAVDLLEQEDYAAVISGIGKEETYFFPGDEANPEEDRIWEEDLLTKLVARGKLVLTVDYCSKAKNKRWVQQQARSKGFVPYLGPVELDRIAPQP